VSGDVANAQVIGAQITLLMRLKNLLVPMKIAAS